MLAVPAPTPLATPRLPTAATVATEGLSELQVESELRFCIEESLNVPSAVNRARLPVAIVGCFGVRARLTIVAFVTVKGIVALSDAKVAVTLAWPGVTPSAIPVNGPIFSTAGLSEDQVTTRVRSCVLPSM